MVKLDSRGLTASIDPQTACVQQLLTGEVDLSPAVRPAGLVVVDDLRDNRRYDPLRERFRVGGLKKFGGAAKGIAFTQHFEQAPFEIAHEIRQTSRGLRWDVRLKLHRGQAANHSLRVTWLLPAPGGWKFWAPQDINPRVNDGLTPVRYAYGHTAFRVYGTMIPLAGIWGDDAGLVAWSPPEIQKPFMTFDLAAQDTPSWVRGIESRFQDVMHFGVSYHHVGLRPGKELHLAVELAGCEPDWRCALGHYAASYPELFEPIPKTRKVEGMYGITGVKGLRDGKLEDFKAAGVTFMELHGHFPQYSVFIEPEAFTNPDLKWTCKPHPDHKDLSLAENREWIRRIQQAGIACFPYYYNCHALPETIAKRWPGSTMLDEAGKPLLKWYTEPSVWGAPESPYGKHMREQIDLMLRAYPEADGFFFDNFTIEKYDFAHDDGVTMVHDRPAYDLNRNHQQLGPPAFDKIHAAGKIVMINKISTIESCRGADMVLSETHAANAIIRHGLACLFKPLFPLGMPLPEGPDRIERGMQHLLVWGAFPDESLYREDPAAGDAYRPLTDCVIGKRWVLQRDPIDPLPDHEAQVFRIDKAAPHGGDVIVPVIDYKRSYKQKDEPMTKGLSITLRLTEAARLKKATWLPVEKPKPVACRMQRTGREITVKLPPVGAAGVLRLTR